MDVAPDGSPVPLYLRLPELGEADIVASVVPPPATVLELGSGAGRVTHALLARGYEVTAVDESAEMLAHIRGAATVHARVESLDLGRTFDCVTLGSHFVNAPAQGDRFALLSACARHVGRDGAVLLETYPLDLEWVPLRETRIDGVVIRLVEAERDGKLVRATMEYEVEGDMWRQSFEAMLLDEADIRADLELAGLRFERWLDDRRAWYLARPRR